MILTLKNKGQLSDKYFWGVIILTIVIICMDVICRTGKFSNIRRAIKNIMLVVFVGTSVGALNDKNNYLSWLVMLVITSFISYEYWPYRRNNDIKVLEQMYIETEYLKNQEKKKDSLWKKLWKFLEELIVFVIGVIFTVYIFTNIFKISDSIPHKEIRIFLIPTSVALVFTLIALFQNAWYKYVKSEKNVRKLIRELSTIIIVPGIVNLSMGSISIITIFTIIGCILVGWCCWYEDE